MRDQLLGGRYRLVDELGAGGMGQVWEARDEKLDRPVAVKLIRMLAGGGSHTTDARARFLREARLTARLQHPNIVTLHDVGEADVEGQATPFLVMERLRGQSLDALLRRGEVTPGDAARWGAQVADALAEAHDVGIMHRDVKPSNIMVTNSGNVKVLDFGIARAADPYATAERLTQTGFIVGTPPYMAPEQARGHAEPRSDLYALGCVLFELLTSRLPFEAPDTMGYLSAHLTDDPPAPSSVAPDVAADWDTLVLRLLEKTPGRRHRSAAELAAALRQLDRPASSAKRGRADQSTVPGPTYEPGEGAFDTRLAAFTAMAAALTCIPPLVYVLSQTATYFKDSGAPMGLLVANTLLGLAETVALGVGLGLLQRRRPAGRRTIAVAGVATALHGLSTTTQYQVAHGPQAVAVIAYVSGPLLAVAAATAAVAALRPSTALWCRDPRTAPSPVVRAGTIAFALLSLFTAPVLPVAAAQAVDAGGTTYEAAVVKAVFFSLLSAVLATGTILVLVRHPAGRILVATGGLGFALLSLNALLYAETYGSVFRILLILLALTAAATTVRATLPPGPRSQRR
ncbi:serine/threonine-protein kinase [Streptomyces sp. NPDC007063]|uniref:serine/threonine-protein kinase n=1 Tax=Streptomyces sp. NPDC007063 TaxID=3364772 RepID=UPI0036A211F7